MDLQSSLLQRLDSDPKARDVDWNVLVLAALEGAEGLEAQLGAGAAAEPRPGKAAESSAAAAPAAFLRSITVAGFRGIGEPATLDLQAGPGLTLVIGRNGCGKSSFAEALELLLTGDTPALPSATTSWARCSTRGRRSCTTRCPRSSASTTWWRRRRSCRRPARRARRR